jgi:hypothetical protein
MSSCTLSLDQKVARFHLLEMVLTFLKYKGSSNGIEPVMWKDYGTFTRSYAFQDDGYIGIAEYGYVQT